MILIGGIGIRRKGLVIVTVCPGGQERDLVVGGASVGGGGIEVVAEEGAEKRDDAAEEEEENEGEGVADGVPGEEGDAEHVQLRSLLE